MSERNSEYWEEVSALDSQLHQEGQIQSGHWLQHEAQDLWLPTYSPDEPQPNLQDETLPSANWESRRFYGGLSVTGNLIVGKAVETLVAIDEEQPVLQTHYQYNIKGLLRRDGQLLVERMPKLGRGEEMPSIDEMLAAGIMAIKHGTRRPEPVDYDMLLHHLRVGASGLNRIPFTATPSD